MINAATIALVKEFEGCKLTAYMDPVGIWTIGYGTTARAGLGITPVEGMTITAEEAEHYLKLGLEAFAADIRPRITAPINDNQFGAFVSLAYNIGSRAFARSSALRHFNEGNTIAAANAILLWVKAGGKVLKGLERRRAAERALFLTPVPEDMPVSAVSERTSVAQSTTMQASAVQVAAASGGALTAISALDGTAQIIAICFAGIALVAALWVMKERMRRWADGDR